MTRALIEGRKKGGGGSEAPDTLRSSQVAEVVLLLEEGEMQGLVNGLKGVYADQVPLENADGTKNFDDVSFAYVTGTPGQAPLPGLVAVQNEVAVGVQVNQGTPVVRTITNAAVDHVRVTIYVPLLQDLDVSNGNLNGSWFEWAVDVQTAGGGYVERHREKIEGKTTTGYSRAVRIELTGSAPWDIRLRRLTIPPPSNIESDFQWASYTEIQSIKLRYQHSAVALLRLSAKAFRTLPVIAVDALNRRVQIPNNYNPITRGYTGVWNGTFTENWTNNPAWVLYDLITDARTGAGDWVAPTVANKWSLYAIGQYCDGLVPDGRGGFEPRFTCNLNIETRAEAFRLIRDLAAVFRGMVFWASSQVDFAQDAPTDPVMTFTPANVVDGRFTYSDVSEKTRHSVFICWWNDMGQFGKRVPEVYVDDTLVARYGLKEIELAPLGCTSRGQAARACRWARYSEEEEGEIVTFEVGSDGVTVAPGRVFKIADPNEQGERLGGRVKSAASTSQVTLDAPVTLAAGETYTLTLLYANSADPTRMNTQSRTVTTAPGTTATLTVSPAFTSTPTAGRVWLLESTGISATTWRCLAVEEVAVKGKGSRRFRITGIAHNPSKYDAIELGLKIDRRPVSRLTTVPPRPASVSVTESPYRVGTQYRSKVTVSWPEPGAGLLYRVGWRISLGPWTVESDTSANAIDIDGLPAGDFECWVQSVNSLGNVSPLREATPVALLGKTTPPANVTGAAYSVVQRGVLISWLACPDLDYLETEIRVGASWNAGVTLFRGSANSYEWVLPALGTYSVRLRHRDTSGNLSNSTTVLTVDVTSAVYVQWGDVTGSGKPLDARNWYFEKGSTDGWQNIASVVADNTASGGWYGLADATNGVQIRPTRPVPVDTDKIYRVRARVRRTSGSAGTLSIGARCFDAAGAGINNTGGGTLHPYCALELGALPGDGAWRTFEGLIAGSQAIPAATTNMAKFLAGTVQAVPLVVKSTPWDGDLQVDYADLVDVTDSQAAEAASFTAWRVWDFKRGLNGWTAGNATFVLSANGVTITGTATNWNMRVTGLAVSGAMFSRIRAKVRRLAGTDWEGNAFYLGTNLAAYSTSFRKQIAEPGRNWQVLEWDMADLTAGGTDWTDSEITAIRLDLASAVGDSFEVEWVALGKLAPAGDVSDASNSAWIGRGVMVTGNNAVKVKATTGVFDSDVYSREWAVGGCFASAQFGQTNLGVAFGLNSDPATDGDIASLDYAFRTLSTGSFQIWEGNVNRGTFGSFTADDVFLVTYDGFKVRYYQNQTLVREVSAPASTAFYFDSAFSGAAAKLNNMRFGPLSKVAGIETGQLGGEAATKVILTTAAGPIAATALSGFPTGYSRFTQILSSGAFVPSPGDAGNVDVLVTVSFNLSVEAVSDTGYCNVLLGNAAVFDSSDRMSLDGVPAGETRPTPMVDTKLFNVPANASVTFALYAQKVYSTTVVELSDIKLRCEVIKR